MENRFRTILALLRQEEIPIQTLAREIGPHLNWFSKSEEDQVFTKVTLDRLHRKWLAKKARVN